MILIPQCFPDLELTTKLFSARPQVCCLDVNTLEESVSFVFCAPIFHWHLSLEESRMHRGAPVQTRRVYPPSPTDTLDPSPNVTRRGTTAS